MGEKKSYFDEQDEGSVDDAVIATEARFDETTTSRTGATALRWVLTLIVFFLFAGMAWLTWSLAPVVVGALASAVLFSCMHVVLEWERSVVLRFGKFNRVAGPGLIFMIPLVEYSAATVDMRMRSTAFKAEHVLTADLVPVNVDAVLFWMVWNPKDACVEVEDYASAIWWAAQTALRDAWGASIWPKLPRGESSWTVRSRISSTKRRVRGASRSYRWRSATSLFPKSCRMPCPRKRRRSASATRDSCSQKSKKTSPRCLSMRRLSTIATTRRSNFAR